MHYRQMAMLIGIGLGVGAMQASALTLVKDSKPLAAIWYTDGGEKAGDRQTAEQILRVCPLN